MMKTRRKSNRRRKYENDLKANEPIVEGVPFYVKFLGSCLVDLPNDEVHTASSVKRLVHEAKYSGIKLRKVSLTISPGGIVQADLETQEELLNVAIHRISYCTADRHHEKVFGFIANDTRTDVLEFYAYLCTKRKIAEALTLTVAQAFHIAYDIWDEVRHDEHSIASSEGSRDEADSPSDSPDSQTDSGESESVSSPHRKSAPQSIPGTAPPSERNISKDQGFSEEDQSFPEIDRRFSDVNEIFSAGASPLPPPPSFDRPPRTTKVLSVSSEAPMISCSAPASTHAPPRPPRRSAYRKPPPPIVIHNHNGESGKYLNSEDTAKLLENWHIEDPDLDDCFSKLAESRSNPQLLDINVHRTIFDTDVIVHFAGDDADRMRLLESESSDSLFLKAATPS
ncbi:uncharacterized protein [Apostichopus japonicus]|uniref:uncharacterized protein n=1 Tax=Stichopus japonicus TaxID=307972 RepID=UPI003AB32E48